MNKQKLHPYCQKCLKEHESKWYIKNGKVFVKDFSDIEDLQICSLIKDFKIEPEVQKVLTKEEIDFAGFLADVGKWSATEFDWSARWYQDQMLRCTAARKVSRIGRRAGKTEAICVKMIYHAYTHEDVIILIVAPYKNQVGLIFDKLDFFLGKSDSLAASIKRNTKNPYRVEFHNGSRILGFTAGTRTGSKSTGIRGQDAHVILIDEADYLSESDFEVILAIQVSRPDVEIWASSTPTGRRDMFWRFCTEPDLGFKEFHFPSSVSPTWTPQIERLEKAQYSEQGYSHEFEANFGEEAEGVFLDKFIDVSLENYDLKKSRINRDSIYTFGVDWNTAGNGTVILVTEWNKNFKNGIGAFKVVKKSVITQEEFTQVRACEEIIRLNAEWNPSYIYVDQGYGHCVTPDTSILTKVGAKNICDMKPGDLVLSEDGDWHTVHTVTERYIDEDIYHIKPRKGLELKITKEHPLLVFDGDKTEWLTPDRINKKNHMISIPRSKQVKDGLTYDLNEIIPGIQSSSDKVWFRTGFSSKTGRLVKVNRKIDGLSLAFLRIVGWYIAEGSIGSKYRNIEFSLNGLKEKKVAEQIKNDIRIVFGINSSIEQRDDSRLRVICSSSIVSKFLAHIAGKGAENKYINNDFLSRSKQVGLLIKSAILGDGYINTNKQEVQYHTISVSLRDTMMQWFVNVGILPSIYIDDRRGSGIKDGSPISKNCNFHTAYSIRFTGASDKLKIFSDITGINLDYSKDKIDRNNYIVSDYFIFVPISSISTQHYSGIVNDLGIKDIHSFVGNGMLLHNTQIEMLRKYGMENPNTGLVNKVKGIYFGDRMEIRDPVTKQRVKKHLKPFMVNLAARRMEDEQIILPYSEDIKNGLVGQIRDYTVIRQTALGQPIYSDTNDHTIVAWMLSILAATIEFSDMAKQGRVIEVGLTGRFGQKQDKDFKVNRKLLEEEKRKSLIVTPRWHTQSLFKDTTLRDGVDYLRKKERVEKRRTSHFNKNKKKYKNLLNSRSNF